MGMMTGLGLSEDFVGFVWEGSSILGIAGLHVIQHRLRVSLMSGYLAKEFQFGT
jgi:HD superfamily phosphodiesterase